MKLTQQQIADAQKVYTLFWDSYLAGDVDTFASTLDDNFEMIGTSESERCHTKEDGIQFFKGQAEEVVGKAEMRNRQINAMPVGDLVLINELCDIYVLAETDWNFYSIIRISTFLRETSDGWKVAQQHGSLPDNRVQDGETLAIDKINRENIELRDAVKRRTAELENKNRELEIEAALELVRARTMAMQHSDELIETSELMFEQIKNLGFELWSCGFSLWYDDDNYFIGYNPGPEGKMGKPLRIPLTEDVFFTTIREAKRRGEEFLVFESQGKSLEQTYRYMDGLPVVGETMRGFVEAGYPLHIPGNPLRFFLRGTSDVHHARTQPGSC